MRNDHREWSVFKAWESTVEDFMPICFGHHLLIIRMSFRKKHLKKIILAYPIWVFTIAPCNKVLNKICN